MGFLFMSVQKKRVLAVISASIIMSAIRTVIVSFFMEKNVSGINAYYLPENLAVLGFAALAALFLAVFVFSAVKLGRKKRLVLENGSASISVGSLIFAFTLIGEAIIYIYSIVIGESEIRSLGVVIFALTVICAVSFLFNVQSSCSKKRSKTVLGLLALLPILLSAFRLLGDFIRTNAMPLASSGAYHLVGLVAVLLYFLCEGKAQISRGSAAVYYFFGFASVFFLLIYAVPNIALFCFGNFDFNYYSSFSIVDLAIGVYICCRMCNTRIVEKDAALEA